MAMTKKEQAELANLQRELAKVDALIEQAAAAQAAAKGAA